MRNGEYRVRARWRRPVGILAAIAAVALGVQWLCYWMWAPRLPGSIGSQWDGAGRQTETMAPLADNVVFSFVIGLVFVLGVCLNYDPLRRRRLRVQVGFAAAIICFVSLFEIQNMRLALGHPVRSVDFAQASDPGLVIGIVVGVIAGVLAARPAAGRPASRVEIAVWQCVIICAEQSMGIAVLLSILALGFFGAGFGFARPGYWLTAAMAALLAIAAVAIGYIQTVLARGELGTSVRLGPLRIAVPCDRQAGMDSRCEPWPESGQWSAWWPRLASDLGLRHPARGRRPH